MFKAAFNSWSITGLLVGLVLLTSSVSLSADIDPTRPFGVSSSNSNSEEIKADDGFVLTSIIHGDGIHTAVINGKIVKMFDYIGEYHITAINSHNVILRSKSQRLKLSIFKSKGFKSNVIANTVTN
ncbi:MAG: MSHA biogenesis protein MshK [Colwellia sp.]